VRISIKARSVKQAPHRGRIYDCNRLRLSHWQTAFARGWVHIWLYRLWPRCPEAMVLVKPAIVVQWHRHGFRLFWRWRSRSGRPSMGHEVRDLIRQMNAANPLCRTSDSR
jgi:hypothetical protein